MVVAGLLILGYLLWRPVSSGQILYPVLAALALISLRRYRYWLRVDVRFVGCVLLVGIAGATSAVVGSFRANPGLVQQSWVWLGGLALWSIWAASFSRKMIRPILLTITIMTSAVSVLILLYIAGKNGTFPAVLPDWFVQAQALGYGDTPDGSAVRLYGLSTLAAAGPLVTAGFLAGKDPLLPPRILMAIGGVLAVFASFVAGRRAIAVVVLLSPLMTYVLIRALRPRQASASWRPRLDPRIAVSMPLVFTAGWFLALTGIFDRAVAGISDGLAVYLGIGHGSGSIKSTNDIDRTIQASQMLAAFRQHPVTGSGLGAELPSGYYRSRERPWLFELQYHQLLFTVGVVGVVLVLGGLALAWLGIRRAAALHPEHVPTLAACCVGALALLIANATNPYLQAVGHGWGIALVVGVANALMRPEPSDTEFLHPSPPGSEIRAHQ
jgi:hypothetical protein